MTPNTPALERLLGQIFDHCQEGLRDEISLAEYEKRREGFIFHMRDWSSDLERLARLYHDPEGQDVETTSRLVMGFLYHVIPHLRAAGRLLLDHVPDPFAAGESTTPAGRPSQGQP